MEQLTQIEWLKRRIADLQLPEGKRDHDTREKFLLQCGMPESAAPVAVKGDWAKDQWWVEELRKVWNGEEASLDTRRAAKVALDFVHAALSPAPVSAEPQPVESLQSRVQPWMMACFGPEISADKLERGDRFLEEAIELLQSVDYPRERIYALVEYVYGRDQGEINQEVGGVMITLAAFCLAHGQDMHEAGETELARIWTKVDKIRAKQAAKPTGSALPIAVASPPDLAAEIARLREVLKALVDDLEIRAAVRSGLKIVDCSNGIYQRARAALADLKGGA